MVRAEVEVVPVQQELIPMVEQDLRRLCLVQLQFMLVEVVLVVVVLEQVEQVVVVLVHPMVLRLQQVELIAEVEVEVVKGLVPVQLVVLA
jgi:hypothetical protein